jgi:hypothetical protein
MSDKVDAPNMRAFVFSVFVFEWGRFGLLVETGMGEVGVVLLRRGLGLEVLNRVIDCLIITELLLRLPSRSRFYHIRIISTAFLLLLRQNGRSMAPSLVVQFRVWDVVLIK